MGVAVAAPLNSNEAATASQLRRNGNLGRPLRLHYDAKNTCQESREALIAFPEREEKSAKN